MTNLSILYISIAGNTRSFVNDLQEYATEQHQINPARPTITLTEISDATPLKAETDPFYAFVPTYLDGGNGIDNGVKELMTNSLGEYIDYADNASLCRGVVGSGNRNFNEQYCLTAKRYGQQFEAPFLADYELRGTSKDVARVYTLLVANLHQSH
ncbi:class Ib ribonucleoside-diphosphate reductase assembly flavoprotein NrdI [Latilactobacillus fuchuensis]|jgi:protein involved in ribonucleotide reduction|uniref:NrdI Flavodoxin like family protein n=1 Tax=Latilactobacillus fuchuensis DSM 14340 = JCM 11249 TaxID=1423747 RepID=A0A0R1RYB0_9LACO|nr:class Ib ribonucleoside-diphosphate reductase assembly flavoprotein NrdI [Latilactobacillus fuchuensis]KRL61967.1 nrdI Flavodoxin like family protein [Latilactobacillus fuchuensis DSM 14340 = JCM 11249]MCP8856716.1 class Ib ribonucleoside-diphosphate reductase assembly flavoprotein NrdI [Latilactobacillus fuchuensis]